MSVSCNHPVADQADYRVAGNCQHIHQEYVDFMRINEEINEPAWNAEHEEHEVMRIVARVIIDAQSNTDQCCNNCDWVAHG